MAFQWSDLDPTYKNSAVRGFFRKIDPTNTPKYKPNPFYSGQQSTTDIQGIINQLGIKPPSDNTQAIKDSTFQQFDQDAQAARTMSDQAAVSRGGYRSGAARAGLDRINTQLASAKTAAGTQIDAQHRREQDDYNRLLLGSVLNNQGQHNAYNLGVGDRSFYANQLNPFLARQDVLSGGMRAAGSFWG
jgi:hypothetical protein